MIRPTQSSTGSSFSIGRLTGTGISLKSSFLFLRAFPHKPYPKRTESTNGASSLTAVVTSLVKFGMFEWSPTSITRISTAIPLISSVSNSLACLTLSTGFWLSFSRTRISSSEKSSCKTQISETSGSLERTWANSNSNIWQVTTPSLGIYWSFLSKS